MNRESARRTRQRKQEQTVYLTAEVCTLETQHVHTQSSTLQSGMVSIVFSSVTETMQLCCHTESSTPLKMQQLS